MAATLHRFRLLGWAFVLLFLTVPAIALFSTVVTFGALTCIAVLTPVFLLFVRALRGLADVHRLWCARALDLPVKRPYRTAPGERLKIKAVLLDRATWRDVAWSIVDGTAGLSICCLVISLFFGGLWYAALPLFITFLPGYHDLYFIHNEATAVAVGLPAGLLLFALWWWLTPKLMRAYGLLTASLLGPSGKAALARRVEQLATSRADTVDTQAAELRRIERDLHDGAQARLVSLGMSLGLADEIVDRDPAAARALLAEARKSSTDALSELRDLVRGIHPPVLADRGLDGAVQALALGSPIPTDVEVDVPGRLPAPVESAAYFAVAESLTNVIKHSGATKAWVRARYSDGSLSLLVGDDGCGGADPAGGTGLRGMERRLAAFDGTLFVTSPPGGPTVATMELPCELSSPRT